MEDYDTLSRHGLFDAKVPRYTSYPPANHFQSDVGMRFQTEWLSHVRHDEAVSIYIHIPFCKRLCWFCACRTQGTVTMRPVDAYVATLNKEIAAMRASLPKGITMGRLHLGGGTPTILSPQTMTSLLETVFGAFSPAADFELSVEIDPTEASEPLLETLIAFGMNRASIGVQDFATQVQDAIGRPQTLAQTTRVVQFLRARGLTAINLDLLYGLPFQTEASFRETLAHVIAMNPDRLAIYGYAHVPWMSKRQVMIKSETLPDTQQRFHLATIAKDVLTASGFHAIGIDHFAKDTDSLYRTAQAGQLRRNFQGYTDDQSETLLGFGASAISHFRDGYLQNAVATSAYQERIAETGLAGHKGYTMTASDQLVAAMIEALMCRFVFPTGELQDRFPTQAELIRQTAEGLMSHFTDVFNLNAKGLEILPRFEPLTRIIAKYIDHFASEDVGHAAAI
ncbi:oxygen-independent coproporphyrinogen III oxidase [Loktanella sp. Alg231-35]|uniref:oxygen-independent coproporphyrinogen III oxidase n=1 Tax=Loktanella sp. Alg231-35 TaxID=1922220 RepID=UPI000D559593|nr:oxygen-independent coproporphyrinogen III oxidase [Loktanella sp. Alg231-35]